MGHATCFVVASVDDGVFGGHEAKSGASHAHGAEPTFGAVGPSSNDADIWTVLSPEEDSVDEGEYVSPGVSGLGLWVWTSM
jgi:hypothetical protein